MCYARNARVEDQMFILTLEMKSATSITYQKTHPLQKTAQIDPHGRERTRARTLGAGQSV